MSVADILANELEANGIGVVNETIQVGRIPAVDRIDENGVWRVTQIDGGVALGGNISRFKTQIPLEIGVIFSSDEENKMYEVDQRIQSIITSIKYHDSRFADVLVSPVADRDMGEAETREAVWVVSAIIINANFSEENNNES